MRDLDGAKRKSMPRGSRQAAVRGTAKVEDLELHAKRQLIDAGRAGCCRKHAEVRIGDIGIAGRRYRCCEAGVVEDVEEVGTEGQVDVAIPGDIEHLVET